jgi:hypothetical protein
MACCSIIHGNHPNENVAEERDQNHMSENNRGKEEIIPETLLALAKDARYVERCKLLLLRMMESIVAAEPSRRSEHVAGFLSSALYALIVLSRKRRTIGMECTGVKYDDSVAKWKLMTGALIAAIFTYGVRRVAASDEGDSRQQEALTGQQRRHVYERQRQQMLERAAAAAAAAASTASATVPSSFNGRLLSTAQQQQQQEQQNNLSKRILQWMTQAAKQLAPALSDAPIGPHNTTTSQQQNRTLTSVATWLFRLHLAFYCLNGVYPTFLHRLVYRSSLQKECTERETLVHRPAASVRIVGLLILGQAAGTLCTVINKKLVRWWFDWTLESGNDRRSHPSSSRRTPCVHFEGLPADETAATAATAQTCGICRLPRKFPACSVRCGHVLCWHCLQQWVAVNEACPLCRKACKVSDILPLHHYRQAT